MTEEWGLQDTHTMWRSKSGEEHCNSSCNLQDCNAGCNLTEKDSESQIKYMILSVVDLSLKLTWKIYAWVWFKIN